MAVQTVLVVDDSENNRILLGRCAERLGHRVVTSEDGRAALALIAAEAPDLVLLDWMMPGMGGLDVLRALRAGNATLPVLMCTANNARDDVRLALDSGADGFIFKPFSFSEVMSQVQAALAGRRAA